MATKFLGRAPWVFAPEEYAEMRAWKPAWGPRSEPSVYYAPLQLITMEESRSMVLTSDGELVRGAPLDRVAPALAGPARFPGPAWCLRVLWNYERNAAGCERRPHAAHGLLPLWVQAPPWVIRFACDTVDCLAVLPSPWYCANPERLREARADLLESLGVLVAAARAAGHPSAGHWGAVRRLAARHWLVAAEGGDAGFARGAARDPEPEPEE